MKDDIARQHDLLKEATEKELFYPEGRFAGRGIVICAGGSRYLVCACVSIILLRELGCRLPIEIWHLGPREINKPMRELLGTLGCKCVDAYEVRKEQPARILNGWELKPYAIIHSMFEEILLLDADNTPVVNPEYLFDQQEYKTAGAVFWPDFGRLGPERPIWKICGVRYRNEPEFESGQILINKRICWRALAVTMHLNEYSDFYYRHIHGDKETFHMAFRRLGQSYVMPSKGIHALPYTMCQHDFDGNRIFQHRNGAKWTLKVDENKTIPGFLFEDRCLEILRELEGRLKDETSMRRFSSQRHSPLELAYVAEITGKVFEYRRLGYDSRPMSFMSNGQVGIGAAGCEVFWDLEKEDKGLILYISSENRLTCRLREEAKNVWRGRWLIAEKMRTELVPT